MLILELSKNSFSCNVQPLVERCQFQECDDSSVVDLPSQRQNAQRRGEEGTVSMFPAFAPRACAEQKTYAHICTILQALKS